jgi:hypothetical protein
VIRNGFCYNIGDSFSASGLFSRPRGFISSLAVAPANQGTFDSDYSACRQLFADKKLTATGRLHDA